MRSHKARPTDKPKNAPRCPQGFTEQWYATSAGGLKVELRKRQRRENEVVLTDGTVLQQLPLPEVTLDTP